MNENFADSLSEHLLKMQYEVVTHFDQTNSSQSVTFTMEHTMCNTAEKRTVTLAESIACVISILTVVENMLILIAIRKGPKSLRKPPYWFIASLSAADLLTGAEVIFAIFIPVGSSPQSRIVLKGIAVVTFIISINSLLLVSFDRYLRIAHYTDYKRFLTRKKIVVLIISSWLMSFVIFLVAPLLGLWSCAKQHCCAEDGLCVCKQSELGNIQCGSICSQSFVPFSKIYLIVGTVYFFLSIFFMIIFYGILFRVVKQRSFGQRRGTAQECKIKKREMKLAKTLIITLGIFVICWLPVVILFLADIAITTPTPQLAKIFDYALVPSVVNSFLNPIIYSIRLPQMRNTVKHIALPCIYGRGLNGLWTTNTSMDSGRKSTQKQGHEKLENRSNSISKKLNNGSCARSKISSNKSLNSISLSNGLSPK